MFTQDFDCVPVHFVISCNRNLTFVTRKAFKSSTTRTIHWSINSPGNLFVGFPLFALGIMADQYHWQVLGMGSKVFDEMLEQGYSVEDAHRAAQTTVNSIFGTSEPSASGATGSGEPAPGAVGPKLPSPNEMLANRAAKAPGWSTGSQPPPLPQAPPSWWGVLGRQILHQHQ